MYGPSDAELWVRARAGDGDAFAEVFDRHNRRLFGAAVSMGGSFNDAEDLVALTFLELWRKRSSARLVNESLLPWLLVTLRNVARNFQRATRRHERFLKSLPAQADDLAADLVLEGRADKAERTELARSLLDGLQPGDQEVLWLRSVQELSHAEIAAVLGITEPSVRKRISRAQKRARDQFSARSLERTEP